MTMPRVIIVSVSLLLAACAPPSSESTMRWETTSRFNPGEAVALAGERHFADCVGDALAKASPMTRIVSANEFRSQLFPWFEPKTAPRTADGLQALIDKPLVAKRLRALNVRYVVFVGGSTGAGKHEVTIPPFLLALGVEKETFVRASVWDLKTVALAGTVRESASGTFLMFPLIVPAATESMACANLADELVSFLAKEPSNAD
jgi:hypothetical protein